jgi:hypothetical protein
MKRLLIFLVLITSLVGCRTVKQIAPPQVFKDSIRIVERLVPIQLPADSSVLEALFECDSTNQVVMKALSEEKSKRVSTQIKFTPGKVAKLDYKSKTKPDTVYLPSKETIRYLEKPYRVEVPVVTNELNWWQKVLMWGGGIFILLLVLAIYNKIKTSI